MKKNLVKKRIGLFGGSFDPPHKGHQNVVQTVLTELNLDELYLIPSYQTPDKPFSKTNPKARMEMVHQSFQNYPQVKVLDNEIKREGPSYTIDTLKELSLSDEVFLILGEEIFQKFCLWKNFEQIIQKVHLVVMLRNKGIFKKENCPFDLKRWVKSYNDTTWTLTTGKEIIFINYNPVFNKISSSLVRNKIRLALSVKKEVPVELNQHIKDSYSYLGRISKDSLHKDICVFLEEKGGLSPQLFCFDQDLYEYILITSGLNTRHVKSLYLSLVEHIQNLYGLSPDHVEGEGLSQWIVLDYGFLIVHIFYDYLRNYYQLEELWKKKVSF